MKKEINHYIEIHSNPCENCEYRREKWGEIPPERCKECGWEKYRMIPYVSYVPVYENGDTL